MSPIFRSFQNNWNVYKLLAHIRPPATKVGGTGEGTGEGLDPRHPNPTPGHPNSISRHPIPTAVPKLTAAPKAH